MYSKESALSVYLTIPVLCSLYLSLIIDVITEEFAGLRMIIFIITIIFIVVLLIVIYPYCFLHHYGLKKWSMIGLILHVIVIIIISSLIHTERGVFSLYGLLEKLAIIGIFISAILSGYSSIQLPMKHLDPFHKKYSDEQIKTKYAELKFMEKRGETRSELYQMIYKEYVIMCESQRANKKKKGVIGIYNKTYGGIMIIYCIYKLINCIIHIIGLTHSDGSSWITKTLFIITKFIHIEINWDSIAQILSFGMVGILVITGIKGLLSKTIKIIISCNNLSSKRVKGSIIVVICYFLTIYSLSFIIMSRSNLIASSHSVIYNIFQDIDYNTYTSFSDLIFFFSACFSIIFFYCKNRFGWFVSYKSKYLPS
ncbi:hypothetical protein, conserved [Entamoeba dispar SAW760]|uniref:Abscisic acid G-protein coupled receptor-like domain-containing protein n=1 Tax=Entamoeba dispar (strain ATCC PRA-260 / SAW760) TaxID=370354 RepID=B0EAI7_ENTDS|nr:uncharacterized protein EDI_324210 [Entamoeba dispar SAW760]EDR28459.1 hypothetical protein, conserved [Entamoeba dispar SAW760]|eukprot:EDR28459.1 hypothetical protein, conserved [Entamoeba dispar SAW760]